MQPSGVNDVASRIMGGELVRNLFSGMALGSLVGLLVGLATTGVVGAVVGALVAVLASFFGLKQAGAAQSGATMRVLGFSLAAVFGLLVGIFLRADNSFSPSLEERNAQWQKAGFSKQVAAELVAFERLGVLRGDWRVPKESIAAAQERSRQMSSALFAAEAAASCGVLTGREYPTADAFADAFRAEGGDWRKFASSVPPGLSEADSLAIYAAALSLVCKPGDK